MIVRADEIQIGADLTLIREVEAITLEADGSETIAPLSLAGAEITWRLSKRLDAPPVLELPAIPELDHPHAARVQLRASDTVALQPGGRRETMEIRLPDGRTLIAHFGLVKLIPAPWPMPSPEV